MVRLWATALALTGIVAAFFAATMVLPLDTLGDPAFDIPMLRARWYGGFGIVAAHLLAIVLTFGLALRWRSLWAALACALLVACLYAILTEYARFIRHGDLIDPHAVSMPRLMWARLATLALSAAALLAVWRGYVRR